jgi:hypothetical protein
MAAPNVIATSGAGIDADGEFTVALPAGSAAGDLILAFVSIPSATTVTASTTTGWTLLGSASGGIYARVLTSGAQPALKFTLDGSEGYEGCAAYACLRYDGSGLVFDVATCVALAGPVSNAGAGSVDCPNLDPAWGSDERSWVVANLIGVSVYPTYLTWPSGFTADQTHSWSSGNGGGSNDAEVAVATKDATAESMDPGTFIHRFDYAHGNNAFTLAVRSGTIVVLEPATIEVEVDFPAGDYLVVSADITLYPDTLEVVVDFPTGVWLSVTSERQVALVGEGLLTPHMTTGGTEGDVLTFHPNRPPTWEVGGGGASALDDLTDVDAAAPSDGDVLTYDDYAGEWVAAAAAAGSGVAEELTTAEMDDALVLMPDGAGGVLWAAGTPGPEGPEGPTGPEGPEGPAGADGAAGATGADGADGATWFAQSAEPVANQAGDLWLDTDDGEVHEWSGAAWVSVGNITGPVGPEGPAGADGADGATLATDTLWDAAGDLVVGSGADTAARLAKGTDGKVLTMVSGAVAWEALPTAATVATDTIWDASGDLVVGSGANTASKLTKGDDGDVLQMVGGAVTWDPPAKRTVALSVVFQTPAANDNIDVLVPFACTVKEWHLLANASGAIVIDVWNDSYANYPPTNDDAMPGAGDEPTIAASGTKAQDTDLSNWDDVSIAAGSTLRFNVDSVTTITRCTLTLVLEV